MARRRGPARWPLAVLVAGFVAAGVAILLTQDDDSADAPTPLHVPIEDVAGEPSPIELARRDVLVTYRVEGFTADGGAVIDTERHWVRAPYESRVETVPGEDEDATPTFVQIAGFGYVQTGRDDEEPIALAIEPSVAPGDVFVDPSGLAWQHQTRTVLDQTCQVFRNGGPIDVARVSEPESQHADVCVAEDGLLLHEEWVIDGKPFRRRIAIAIDDAPTLTDSLFEPTGAMPGGPETGVLAGLTRDSRPAGIPFHALPSASVIPEGFRHRGRYGFTPPRGQIDVTQAEAARVALILDVYDDGAGGVLVVANGTTSDNRPVIEIGDADETVDLGPELGTAGVVRGVRQQELRIPFDRGRFLRVWSTLSVDDLADVARSLEATTDPEGEVVPLAP